MKISIAILGYGSVGKYLVDKILNEPAINAQFDLAFVWNRSKNKYDGLEAKYILEGENLKESYLDHTLKNGYPDLVLEFAHKNIVEEMGAIILQNSDLLVSTITALANQEVYDRLIGAAIEHSIYLPTGAAWGVEDIIKMDRSKSIQSLSVSMHFNAHALKLASPYKEHIESFIEDENQVGPIMICKGFVREIAKYAPNNVNTMCCLAMAADSIGLDKTLGFLFAHKREIPHLVETEIRGINGFFVKSSRSNPAKKDAVTGEQTYISFLMSLLNYQKGRIGLHFS